jgi:hypothetical protein
VTVQLPIFNGNTLSNACWMRYASSTIRAKDSIFNFDDSTDETIGSRTRSSATPPSDIRSAIHRDKRAGFSRRVEQGLKRRRGICRHLDADFCRHPTLSDCSTTHRCTRRYGANALDPHQSQLSLLTELKRSCSTG